MSLLAELVRFLGCLSINMPLLAELRALPLPGDARLVSENSIWI